MSGDPLAARFACRAHRPHLTEEMGPRLTWHSLMALTNELGPAGRALRSAVYGTAGVVDVWRHRDLVRADHDLAAALLLAARTGCGTRDIVALRTCGGGELSALHGIVPRARRAEYRDWNNCVVGAATINDKLRCGGRLRDAGIEVATQFPLDAGVRVRHGGAPAVLELFHPSLPDGSRWMLKDRRGLQGGSVWKAVARARFGPGDDTGLAATVRNLARAGRLMAEEWLDPEEWFAGAGDSALPTVRVVTSMLRGRTEVVGLVLFRGAAGAVAANRRQGGTAHLVSPDGACARGVDASGATRGECGYRFSGPLLTRLRAMCVEAHELFPCVASVGWDVGLSGRGPFLLEGNPNWGMNVPQLMPGRPMLMDFRRSRFRAVRFARPG